MPADLVTSPAKIILKVNFESFQNKLKFVDVG